MAVLKTIIGGVPVKKTVIKYDPKIFALYRSALVEHMKGVKGKPPVMLFVAVAVALFAIVQLGSYVKTHGGIIPKPNVSQSQEKEAKEKEVNNEKRPSGRWFSLSFWFLWVSFSFFRFWFLSLLFLSFLLLLSFRFLWVFFFSFLSFWFFLPWFFLPFFSLSFQWWLWLYRY
jgi:hypothetical protein